MRISALAKHDWVSNFMFVWKGFQWVTKRLGRPIAGRVIKFDGSIGRARFYWNFVIQWVYMGVDRRVRVHSYFVRCLFSTQHLTVCGCVLFDTHCQPRQLLVHCERDYLITFYANALLFHLVKAKLCNISLILWLITWVFSRKAFSQVMKLSSRRESLCSSRSHSTTLFFGDWLPACRCAVTQR